MGFISIRAFGFQQGQFQGWNRHGLREQGNLTLDCVKVKCVADIELGMLSGTGGLIKMD